MITERLPVPIGGYDGRDAFTIAQNATPGLRNVRTFRNFVAKAPGRTVLGNGILLAAGQKVRNIFQYDMGLTSPNLRRVGVWSNNFFVIEDPLTGVYSTVQNFANSSTTRRFGIANTLGVVAYSEGRELNIQGYDGVTASDLITSGQNHAAKWLLGFANRIISLRPYYDNLDHYVEIRWSVNGNPHDWAGDGSGVLAIQETSMAPLQGGFVLNDRCYLGKYYEILELVSTGNIDEPFVAVSRVKGTGIAAGYSVSTGDQFTFWVGADNVYMYDGANLSPVGDKVFHQIAPLIAQSANDSGNDGANSIDDIQGQVYNELSEYHILFPNAQLEYIYDYKRDRWFIDTATNTDSIGSGTLSGTGVSTLRKQYLIYADRSGSNVRVMLADPNVGSYLDGIHNCYVTIKERIPRRQSRQAFQPPTESLEWVNELLVVRFQTLAAYTTIVSVSTDGGATFPNSQTLSPIAGSGNVQRTAWFQIAFADSLMLKFENNTTDFWGIQNVIEVGYEEIGARTT
jgi:hypothetical protein